MNFGPLVSQLSYLESLGDALSPRDLLTGKNNMDMNLSPNNEPKLVISQSNLRPTIKRLAPHDVAQAFWTVPDLVKKYAESPDDLVPGMFSRNVSMVQGKPGSGKSIIAMELVAAYTNDSLFLGEVQCNPDPERPNVAYFDQDNFSHEVLLERLKAFEVDEDRFFVPQGTLLLDDPLSYTQIAKVIKDNKVGLTILDSAHAFHKQRDRRLDQMRDGFKALIEAGSAVVILSHITKSGSADDSNAAEGSGLPAACDFVWGMTEVDFGQFRMKPVKVRQAKGRNPETVTIIFNGESRPEKEPDISLEEIILQHIADAGETGTNLGAIRKLGGKDNVKQALSNLTDMYYCDGKRGPGNHIWDLKFKPTVDADSSDDDDEVNGNDGGLAAA